MPANLTPDYLAAEARFRAAETVEEKLAALDEMYATIPKHKGTEKLRADIKRRISKLREKDKQSGKKGQADEFHVVKQGAGQVVVFGPPNSGKSLIVGKLTSARVEVADYPFTTRRPQPGMMEYEDVGVQLVDTPPISKDYFERGIITLIRIADAAALVIDCSDNEILDQIDYIREELARSRTTLTGNVEKESEDRATVGKRTIIIANKIDLPGSADNLDVLRDIYGQEFTIKPVSATTGEGLEQLKVAIFELLSIIRVYTKVPGKPPDMDRPFTLPKGSTLLDFAAAIHKDFVHRLRFARAWGAHIVDGAQIGRDHVLEDGDIVELHV